MRAVLVVTLMLLWLFFDLAMHKMEKCAIFGVGGIKMQTAHTKSEVLDFGEYRLARMDFCMSNCTKDHS